MNLTIVHLEIFTLGQAGFKFSLGFLYLSLSLHIHIVSHLHHLLSVKFLFQSSFPSLPLVVFPKAHLLKRVPKEQGMDQDKELRKDPRRKYLCTVGLKTNDNEPIILKGSTRGTVQLIERERKLKEKLDNYHSLIKQTNRARGET